MLNHYLLICLLMGLTTVAMANGNHTYPPTKPPMFMSDGLENQPFADAIIDGESQATPEGQKVLLQARRMMADGEIIKGGCWDYLNEAWKRAGYPDKKRQTIFKGQYKQAPYADIEQIQAGDWLYYVNYSYNQIEHSGMFVTWIDKDNYQGLIFSYAGENRKEPARYRVYDLRSVYQIIRAQD